MRNHFLRASGVPSSGSSIITDDLVIHLDAGDSSSYSGSGSTWTNIAPSGTSWGNATLKTSSGLNTYSSSDGGYFTTPRAYIPHPSGSGTFTTFTYSVWCYPTTVSGGYDTLFDQDNDKWFIGLMNDTFITYNPTFNVSDFDLLANNWYNLVVAHTHTQAVRFYSNGQLKFTSTTNSTSHTFSNISIGAGGVTSSSTGDETWPGRIASILIYDTELTASEVTTNYNAEKARFGY
tara:strand:- start:517 stop:1218 length:702 start_codon:yes stop_codon:yes gene_type:complete